MGDQNAAGYSISYFRKPPVLSRDAPPTTSPMAIPVTPACAPGVVHSHVDASTSTDFFEMLPLCNAGFRGAALNFDALRLIAPQPPLDLGQTTPSQTSAIPYHTCPPHQQSQPSQPLLLPHQTHQPHDPPLPYQSTKSRKRWVCDELPQQPNQQNDPTPPRHLPHPPRTAHPSAMSVVGLPELWGVDTMLRREGPSEAPSSDDTGNVALGDGANVQNDPSGVSFFRQPVHSLATGALPKSSDDGYGTCSDDSSAGHAGCHYPHSSFNAAQYPRFKAATSAADASAATRCTTSTQHRLRTQHPTRWQTQQPNSMSDDSLQVPHYTTAKYSCGSSDSSCWYIALGVKEFNRACKKRKVSGEMKQTYQKARRRAKCRDYAIRGRQKKRQEKKQGTFNEESVQYESGQTSTPAEHEPPPPPPTLPPPRQPYPPHTKHV